MDRWRPRLLSGMLLGLAVAWPAMAQSTLPQEPTDWDLYMLRLVNRARTDPAGENIRQQTDFEQVPVGPLAYATRIGQSAQNHNQWMALNRDNPDIDNPKNTGPAPDSFSHFETLNGDPSGPVASETSGFSGAMISDRVTFTGIPWLSVGENLLWRSDAPAIDAALMEANHAGWWNSDGHRQTMMNRGFTAFGHAVISDANVWATQNFARPRLPEPTYYAFGLVYDDLNDNGQWDPHDADDPSREGLAGQAVRIFDAESGTQLGDPRATLDNGTLSLPLDDGTYNIELSIDSLGAIYTFADVVIAGANVDLGDLDIGTLAPLLGDMDGNGLVDFDDVPPFVLGLNDAAAYGQQYGVPPSLRGDIDADGDLDFDDISGFTLRLTDNPTGGWQAIPEPATCLLACVGLALLLAVQQRCAKRANGRRRLNVCTFTLKIISALLFTCATHVLPVTAATPPPVRFEIQPGQVAITIGGHPFATYVYTDGKIPRPYFAHVHAPCGVQVTRHHPPTPEDRQDHPLYHPGLWLAFGDISGNDYWRLKAQVVHGHFLERPRGGEGRGTFAVLNRYLSADGTKTVCREECRWTILARPTSYFILWDSTFHSDTGDFAFGDQEEMGLGVRVATPIAVESHQGGRMLDSKGRVNGKRIWGQQADWCDDSGTVDGHPVGVTLMGDPRNVRTCWWHARDYGFVAANPFGRHAMTDGAVSKIVVRKGQTFHLRYGVAIHDGTPTSGYEPAEAYANYLQESRR
jgi:hypothetical protein